MQISRFPVRAKLRSEAKSARALRDPETARRAPAARGGHAAQRGGDRLDGSPGAAALRRNLIVQLALLRDDLWQAIIDYGAAVLGM
jgi:hypothetical protein